MYNANIVIEIIEQILSALQIIKRRFENINSSDDFLNTDNGLDMLDAICMQLIAVGESIKNIDKISNSKLLTNYPDIDWKGIKGVRDIISHHYFDLDADEIYNICNNNIGPLAETLIKIKEEVEQSLRPRRFGGQVLTV